MSAAVICLSSPVDVLSVVPHLLGFHPSQSLVLVCLTSHGKGARVGLVARMDLPAEGQAAEAADALLPALAREDPDAAVVIAYGTPADEGTVAVEAQRCPERGRRPGWGPAGRGRGPVAVP